MEGAAFLLVSVHLLLLFTLSLGAGIPLRQGWSFSADLSSSSPLPLNAFFSPSLSLFAPVLSSSNFSTGKGFSLAFLSFLSSSSPLPTSISLSICLGTNMVDSLGKVYAIPVWNLNTSAPFKQVGTAGKVLMQAEASSGGDSIVDLVIRNGDGSELWRVGGVVAMEMQDNGNWVLYNTSNEVIWQSYEHLGDTFLQGQKISMGKKVVSRNSLYVMEMKPGGLFAQYMESQAPAPLYYWGYPINSSAIVQYVTMHALDLSPNPSFNITASFLSYACPPGSPGFIEPYASLAGPNLTVQGGCALSAWPGFSNVIANHSYSADFVRLTDYGMLEGFTFLHRSGENTAVSAQAGTSSCLVPNACGPYGICNSFLFSSQRSCQCPGAGNNEQLSNVFHPIDPSDLARGCARTTPLQCLNNSSNKLVEMKRSSLSALHIMYETTYKDYTYPLQECIERCSSICSCAGFFYHRVSSFCLPYSDTTGPSNLSFVFIDSPAFSVYVKVQLGEASSDAQVSESASSIANAFTPITQSNKHIIKPVVYTICAISVTLLACVIILAIKRYRRHVWIRKLEFSCGIDTDIYEDELQEALPMLPIRYSYKELHEVTQGFKKLLGSGAFGSVYEGVLRDGRRVAVKKLDQVSPRMKQFLAEVTTIGGISHYNVVRLYGFCSQKSKRLLVYEFMENGSLDKWLFCRDKERLLSWSTRFKIALGTARGLAYLHSECTQPIIHFDVKPQNILVDKNFAPKLSDFGLSKLVERESSFVMTGVRGTPGYLAPEWLSHSVVSKKCDVYSYGMVLLELVGGRRNTVQALVGSDEWYFPTWASLKCQQGKITELVDKGLEGYFDKDQVKLIVHVAFLCIQREPALRPTMGYVCKMLDGLVPFNGEETPSFSLMLEQPLSPEADFSLGSCSIVKEGR